MSPDGANGESFLYDGQVEKVYFVVTPGCRSPISRLIQALMTVMEIWFAPGLRAAVMGERQICEDKPAAQSVVPNYAPQSLFERRC